MREVVSALSTSDYNRLQGKLSKAATLEEMKEILNEIIVRMYYSTEYIEQEDE